MKLLLGETPHFGYIPGGSRIEWWDMGQIARIDLSWRDRINSYVRETGRERSLFIADDGRVVGTWIIGEDPNARSPFHGGHPAGCRRRIAALFPECKRVLNVFSGQVGVVATDSDAVSFDQTIDPTYVDGTQTLVRIPLEKYGLVIVDPDHAQHQARDGQSGLFKSEVVLRGLQCCAPGTFIVWLDRRLPAYREDKFSVEATIALWEPSSSWFRGITIFRRS